MKANWKAWLGLGVSVFLLWWVFRGEDLGAIAERLTAADPLLLALSGAISTSGGLIRALRWRLLLEPLGVRTSLHARWASLNIGFMVTNVFAARFGEIARPFALSRITPVSMSAALGTVVLERLLDTSALLLLLLLALASPAFPENATVLGRSIGFAVSGVMLVGSAALVLVVCLLVWPTVVTRLVRFCARVLPDHLEDGVVAGIGSFLSGLELLRRPSAMVKALLWSLLLWTWMAASFWAAFRAFGIELGATAAMFTQCAVAMFVALPAGPGFIGTMQAGVSVSVQDVFGIAAEPTLSLAVGYHLAGFIPVTALGFYYAWRMGLHLGSLKGEAESAMEGESPGGATQQAIATDPSEG